MAKSKTQSKQDRDLVDRLHASGIRKRTAELITQAADGRRKPRKQVNAIIEQMNKAMSDVEDRVKGGPAKRKAAAKKGAATRKKNSVTRSASAKKAAVTRKSDS